MNKTDILSHKFFTEKSMTWHLGENRYTEIVSGSREVFKLCNSTNKFGLTELKTMIEEVVKPHPLLPPQGELNCCITLYGTSSEKESLYNSLGNGGNWVRMNVALRFGINSASASITITRLSGMCGMMYLSLASGANELAQTAILQWAMELVKQWGYTIVQYTARPDQNVYTLLEDTFKFKKVFEFKNRRTHNDIKVFVKEL